MGDSSLVEGSDTVDQLKEECFKEGGITNEHALALRRYQTHRRLLLSILVDKLEEVAILTVIKSKEVADFIHSIDSDEFVLLE